MTSHRSTSRMGVAVIAIVAMAAAAGCTSSSANSDAVPITTTTAPAPQPLQDRVAAHAECLAPVATIAGEEWSYCQATIDLELLDVSWVVGDVRYTERFGLVDRSLAYALESTGPVEGGPRLAPWSVEYLIDDARVIDHWSIGLGPTESDDWEAAAILDRWAEREATASQIRSGN